MSKVTETNAGDAEEGLVQLDLWAAAWYKRTGAFDPCDAPALSTLPSPPALPLVLVEGAAWNLYFARPCVGFMSIASPLNLCSTDALHGTFRVVAVLARFQVRRMEDLFQRWILQIPPQYLST